MGGAWKCGRWCANDGREKKPDDEEHECSIWLEPLTQPTPRRIRVICVLISTLSMLRSEIHFNGLQIATLQSESVAEQAMKDSFVTATPC